MEVSVQLAMLFNELHLYPVYTVFFGRGDDFWNYTSTDDNFYKIASDPGYFRPVPTYTLECGADYFWCLNHALYRYAWHDWWIVITFDKSIISAIESYLFLFFEEYIEKYIDDTLEKDSYFVIRETNKLLLSSQSSFGTLNMIFNGSYSNRVFHILLKKWRIDWWKIIDRKDNTIFPYDLNFKPVINSANEDKQKVPVKIERGKVYILWMCVFNTSKKTIRNIDKIIEYLVRFYNDSEIIDTNDIYHFTEGVDWTEEDYKNYKDRLARVNEKIEEAVGLKLFISKWPKEIWTNPQIEIISE